MTKYLVLAWIVQDFFAVLMSDALLIPDVFLLSIFCISFSRKEASDELDIFLIWAAFAGGVLWDLRWTGVLGFFAFLYVSAFLCARWAWSCFPKSGHTVMIFFVLSWSFQLPGFIASLYLWNVEASLYLRSLILYQAYSIPLAAVFSFFYVRSLKIRNV